VESKWATKATGTRISCIAPAKKANTRKIPIIDFAKLLILAGPVGVIHVPSASSVICVVTNCRNDPWPGEDEAWFVTVNFMARELHGLSDVNTEMDPSSEIRREAGTATTRIPVLRHRNQTRLGAGGGVVPPSHAFVLATIGTQPSSFASPSARRRRCGA
jgi:hypothetical protein